MNKRVFIIEGLAFLLIGLVFLLNSFSSITGAVILENVGVDISGLLGLVFVIAGLVVMMGGEGGLEKSVEKSWIKYPVSPDSAIQDIEQEYLGKPFKQKKRTPLQEKIEKTVTGGRLIDDERLNRRGTYQKQFYEGHASKGGRIIDVPSHIATKGKNKGKLMHFGQPANAIYLWVVDENGNFIVGNRQTMLHEMLQMEQSKVDYPHRLHKLPHPTLARGKKIYGSGEVFVEGGLVRSYNSASGHYVDLTNIGDFDRQSKDVFEYFREKNGWKEIEGGAKYKKK